MVSKYLVVACGLPGMGKTTLMDEIGDISRQNDYGFRLFNSGELRRADTRYNWLKSPDDFKNNPGVLDEISSETLKQSVSFLGDCDGNVVIGFDQTFTRKNSREGIWQILHSSSELQYIVAEVYAGVDRELIPGFRRKSQSKDFSDMSFEESFKDFVRRLGIYMERSTHFSEDDFFQEHRPAYARLERTTGAIEMGNQQNTSPELIDIVVDAMKRLNERFGHSSTVSVADAQ
jgi:hypothetical protein